MKLALKIDVATLRDSPPSSKFCSATGPGATFLFNLRPDRSGLHGKFAPAPAWHRLSKGPLRNFQVVLRLSHGRNPFHGESSP